MKPKKIDVEECLRLYYIDEDNHLRYKISRGGNGKAGELAGYFCLTKEGRRYIRVGTGANRHLAHRVIYAMIHKKDPGVNRDVDHKLPILVEWKGHQVLSNAKSNLRLATDQQTSQNRLYDGKPPKGYYWNKAKKKFMASIGHLGKKIFLGYFDTADEASAAYIAAKNELCGRFTPAEIRVT